MIRVSLPDSATGVVEELAALGMEDGRRPAQQMACEQAKTLAQAILASLGALPLTPKRCQANPGERAI